MNAQEAIEREAVELEDLKQRLEHHKHMAEISKDGTYVKYKTHHETQILILEEQYEQKSIVLESAKTLQEIRDKALSYAFIKDIDSNNIELYEFTKWVFDKAEGFEVEE